jgi:hypothetical protein
MVSFAALPSRATPFSGEPSGVQPVMVGQLFHDTGDDTLYVANSLTLGDISAVSGSSGGGAVEILYGTTEPGYGVANPTYGGDNPTGLSFYIQSTGSTNNLFYGVDTTGGTLSISNHYGDGWAKLEIAPPPFSGGV